MRSFGSPRCTRCSQVSQLAFTVSVMLVTLQSPAHAREKERERSMEHQTSYRTIKIVDGGHFALDTAADQIAMLVRDFMK
jgi:hypothetical protein